MSLEHAEQLVRDGFANEAFVPVTNQSPYLHAAVQHQYAIVVLGMPFDFKLTDYHKHVNRDGHMEYLVPGEVLNRYQRAIWPR